MVSRLPTSLSSTCSPGSVACGRDSRGSRTAEAGASTPPSGIASVGRPTGRTSSRTSRLQVTSGRCQPKTSRSMTLLLAGFPCQPFSLAGISKKNSLGRPHGFADETQGHAVFLTSPVFCDITNLRRSSSENVKHLQNHDRGRTMKVILRTLKELGYNDVTTRVIDARVVRSPAPPARVHCRLSWGFRL